MNFHYPNQQGDDLEKICKIQFLDAAHYEHLTVVLKRAYCRISLGRTNRMLDTSSAL